MPITFLIKFLNTELLTHKELTMSNIYSAMVGSYPRPAGLAKLINRFNSGKISSEDLELGYERYTYRLLKFLTKLNIDYFTDGMLRWDDIFNPLINYVDGVKVNGLYRFYENNFFFRAPQVVGKVRLMDDCPIPQWFKKSSEILESVIKELGIKSRPVLKPVLPGPLTLAINSLNERYSNMRELIGDYVFEVLTPLIKALRDLGAQVIEIHEPELTYGRVDPGLKCYVAGLLGRISYDLKIKLWIQTYFGSASNALECFKFISNNIVGIDLVASRDDYLNYIHNFSYYDSLAVGVYDSRSTVLERSRIIRWYVAKFLKLRIGNLFIANNAPMDFIPEVIAVKKLRRLSKFTKWLKSKVGGVAR